VGKYKCISGLEDNIKTDLKRNVMGECGKDISGIRTSICPQWLRKTTRNVS
jgi:hypothetical protein